MNTKIVRFVVLTVFLVSMSVIGCKKPAQDICIDQPIDSQCSIDMGCGEEDVPGTCLPQGRNGTMTCIPN